MLCRLGTYYARLPDGGRSLFAEGESLKGVRLVDLKVRFSLCFAFLCCFLWQRMRTWARLTQGTCTPGGDLPHTLDPRHVALDFQPPVPPHPLLGARVCVPRGLQVYVADGPPVEFELDGVVWKTKQGG